MPGMYTLKKRGYPTSLAVSLALGASILLLFVPSKEPSRSPRARSRTLQVQPRQENDEARIAYLIQTYDQSIHLVPSLLEAIWHQDNIYAIHVDAKVPPRHTEQLLEVLESEKYRGNVFLMPSEPVTYLGITTVLNTINAISFLLEKSADWDFFINLSGEDYPLTSAKFVRALLSDQSIRGEQLNFVQPSKGSNRVVEDEAHKSRFSRIMIDKSLWTPYTIGENQKVGKNRHHSKLNCEYGCLWGSSKLVSTHPLMESDLGTLDIVKTEAWVILHRTFAEFVADSALSRRLLLLLSNVLCPEEYFFGTLLVLSESFRRTIVFDSFRSVFWSHKDPGSSSRPPELDSGKIKDAAELLRGSGSLFCRKRSRTSSEIKDFIDKNLIDNNGEHVTSSATEGIHSEHIMRVKQRVSCMVQFRTASDKELEFQSCLRRTRAR